MDSELDDDAVAVDAWEIRYSPQVAGKSYFSIRVFVMVVLAHNPQTGMLWVPCPYPNPPYQGTAAIRNHTISECSPALPQLGKNRLCNEKKIEKKNNNMELLLLKRKLDRELYQREKGQ